MGLIPKVLNVALLVGGLAVTVATAGESPCESPYKGRTPTPEEFATVLRNHQAWLASERKPDDERRANLCWANLQGAILNGVNLQQAQLAWANLQQAHLIVANLQKALLVDANLQEAWLDGANLQEAYLNGANLQKAHLGRANLQEAHLSGANLQRAVYDPHPGKLPLFWTLTGPHNHLDELVFHESPAGLIALREAVKRAGMRTQERQLTYAIEHTKQLHVWNPAWYKTPNEDPRPWLEQLAGKSESLFSYVWFELPSGYGMAPSRALWSLLGFMPGFALFYWIALQRMQGHSCNDPIT